MTDNKRESLIDRLQGFEHQAKIAIRDARKVRKTLLAGKDDKAAQECCDLDFSVSALNGWICCLPKGRTLNNECSQCKFFALNRCYKTTLYVMGSSEACQHFSLRKGDKS